MSNLTSAINVNVNTETKNKANEILKDLGLNMSTFINMALTQVVKKNGVPFKITNPEPSQELLDSLQEIEDYKNGKIQLDSYKDIKSLRKALLDE